MSGLTPLHQPGSDIPAMRLEDLHGALRGDMRKPWGSAALLFAIAVLVLLTCLGSTDKNRKKTRDGNVISDNTGIPGTTATQLPAIDPRKRDQLLLQQLRQQTSPTLTHPSADLSPKKAVRLGPVPEHHVRVAAIQIYSAFGDKEHNLRRIAAVVQQAAGNHVQIIVLPEAAIPGYADPTECTYWTKSRPRAKDKRKIVEHAGTLANRPITFYAVEDAENDIYYELYDIRAVAEPADGASINAIAALAKKYNVYITAPFIEQDGDRFYSSVILVNNHGKPVLHARKHQPWETGDAEWLTPGSGPIKTVDTEYGRIGISFSYDIRRLSVLAAQKTNLVLQCSALYGKDFESIFLSRKFIRAIRRAGFALIIANWIYKYTPPWEGYGMSRIILPNGTTRRISNKADDKEGMVIADIPIGDPEKAGR